MVLDLKLVGKAGLVWGIIGLVLMVAVALLSRILPASLSLEGLSLVGYAALFAGVHFGLRSPANWIVALIGGAIAGLIAALLIMLVAMLIGRFTPLGGGEAFSTARIVGGLIAGLAGGLGIKLAQRF